MKKSIHDLMEQSRKQAEAEGTVYRAPKARRISDKPRIALGQKQVLN